MISVQNSNGNISRINPNVMFLIAFIMMLIV